VITAIIFLVLFLIGLGAVWIVKRALGGLSEASALALIVGPIVLYAAASGAIAEFSGFGVTAKFNKAANVQINDLAGSLVTKSNIDPTNFEIAATLQLCATYFIIRDDIGQQADDPKFLHLAKQLAAAIKSSMLCGNFYGVVVVNKTNHFLGLFPRSRLEGLMSYAFDRYCIFDYPNCDATIDIRNVLGETELGVILRNPDVRAETDEALKYSVQETDPLIKVVNDEAFAKVTALAVLDRKGKFVGLLPKQAVYDKLFSILLASN